ncbi:AAA family ATPase [Aeromonas hydrophila]|uniref:AAA family ATPase n=1 Tax=Aeromonas hydrophila TaxID=644 RepID=UPI0009BDEB24|nr:AAA family ATPase [Aeromonas hydrophila]HAU4927727.1 AAA family ATPase [Aeromonas hydrophila]
MRVKLEKIKGINNLEFEIPTQGLWLLTGLNGSGKTTILAALYRINHARAFQDYYKTTATQSRVDTFKDSKITYSINNNEVSYSYGGKRWPPTPKRNSTLLSNFPFPNIQFIEANSNRIEPYADEILPRRVNDADINICEFLSSVLDDRKWNNIKYVNTRRGVGSRAFLLPYNVGRETHYYSEKNFSLGELCILRLAEKLTTIQNDSLVLIDEVEMALHPQAQVRLLRQLERITTEKNLTVIFSTHSATLIKNINKTKIIFLSGNDGNILVKKNVFPAHILGEIAFDEEVNSDFIFFVEDEQAKILLEQMCGKYHENDNNHKPMYKVVPIGGFYQVLQLLDRAIQIFPPHVKRFAFLDDDVRTDAIPDARQRNNNEITAIYDRLVNTVKFLPCTPELGLTTYLEQAPVNITFGATHVRINHHLNSPEYQNIRGETPRKTAKRKLDSIVNYIHARSGLDDISIRRILYRKYIDNHYVNIGDLKRLLGPVFNAR